MDVSDSAQVASAALAHSVADSRYKPRADSDGKVLLLSDGKLLISRSHRTDIGVLAYIDQLRRLKVPFVLEDADPELIARIANGESHANAAEAKAADHSDRQNQVLDYIREAVSQKASDIHFVNYEHKTMIRWRVHGSLITKHVILADDGQALCRCMYETMTDNADPQYLEREPQDGRLSRKFMTLSGLNGARIATRPKEYGNLVVLRLLYQQGRVLTLQEAGYLPVQIAALETMLRRKGIVLFSGETGSGKSSSLAILMHRLLNLFKQNIHLLTIENPLEYVIEGAVQTILTGDLNTPEGISRAWAAAITNAVRLDLDYLMVGELRDKASALAAIDAALTGHGMFSTIHAEEIFAILDRLADFGLDLRRLSNPKLFKGLANQALAPILCRTCRVPFSQHYRELDEVTAERVRRFCTPDTVYLRGTANDCPQCGGMGYTERKLVAEVCVTDKALLSIYREHGSADARSYWVNRMDGITKNAHTIMRINAGELDPFDGDSIVPLDEDALTIEAFH